jgi:hypothetical protein
MKIYCIKYGNYLHEKDVLDKETEHSFFYLDHKGKECSMRKFNNYEHWFKSIKEAVKYELSILNEIVEKKEDFLIYAKNSVISFNKEFKQYLD